MVVACYFSDICHHVISDGVGLGGFAFGEHFLPRREVVAHFDCETFGEDIG